MNNNTTIRVNVTIALVALFNWFTKSLKIGEDFNNNKRSFSVNSHCMSVSYNHVLV